MGAVDINSEIGLLGKSRLTRVDAHPDAEPELIRPLVELERPLRREGRLHRLRGVRERREELVRAAVDFDPARFRDRGSDQTAVIHE